MCTCITEIKETLYKQAVEEGKKQGWTILPPEQWNGEGLKNIIHLLARKNETLNVCPEQLSTQYVVRYTFEKKDKTTSRPKVSHSNITFNFCPFCGKSYTEVVEEKKEATHA